MRKAEGPRASASAHARAAEQRFVGRSNCGAGGAGRWGSQMWHTGGMGKRGPGGAGRLAIGRGAWGELPTRGNEILAA
eukprot:13211464-Alexandrium_andersonii.AAC.1